MAKRCVDGFFEGECERPTCPHFNSKGRNVSNVKERARCKRCKRCLPDNGKPCPCESRMGYLNLATPHNSSKRSNDGVREVMRLFEKLHLRDKRRVLAKVQKALSENEKSETAEEMGGEL